MAFLATIRQRFTARGVAALISLLWLNLAMLPCAMALEGEHNCPNCPPEHDQPMASHHDHADADADTAPDCKTAQADCCDLEDFSIDDRGQKSSQKDGKNGGEQFTMSSTTDPVRRARPVQAAHFPTGPPDPNPGARRLHALHCVYLK